LPAADGLAVTFAKPLAYTHTYAYTDADTDAHTGSATFGARVQ
jgi:hypothetical protein